MRTYSELIQIPDFFGRFEYLKLDGKLGAETFGIDRYLNQVLYRSREWKKVRDYVIIRDNGCDLGLDGFEIYGKVLVHHTNPITVQQVMDRDPSIFNPDYLITVSQDTHNAIHYANEEIIKANQFIERTKGDTCPWKKAF